MPDAASGSDLEAERILTGLARGRFGRIAPDRIARHVLESQPQADWAVRKAAFDALARRYGFAQRDALHVTERPAQGVLGSYRTGSHAKGSAGLTRPYETTLAAVAPLATSCACADFVRSSLGLCKHGLVVLELLEERGLLGKAEPSTALTPALTWGYAQPPHGPFDRLSRLQLDTSRRLLQQDAGALVLRERSVGFAQGTPGRDVLGDLDQRLLFIGALEDAVREGQVSAEPAVSTLLAEERARTERRRALQPFQAAALASLGALKRTLYPYQQAGVERFLACGRLLLADDMGLGKTTQAIAGCHALLHVGAIKRALLIVPTPLKTQWRREWESTTAEPIRLVEGSPKERRRLYRTTERGVLVLGYEQLLRDLEHVQGYAPELVVLDEAQRIKNWATKSAAYVKSLAPAYRLVLTGTPMENRFDELASIMDFVDDLALEPKWRLTPFHSVSSPDDKRSAGARHLDVLRTRLAPAMLRRSRGEVLTQLPERTDTQVPVEMTDAQRARHDELRQPIAELAARAERRALAPGEFMRLMQLLTLQRMICNGLAQVQFDEAWPRCQSASPTPALLESLFSPKLSVLRGLIEQVVVEQRRKVVVFSQWRKLLSLGEWAVRDVLAEQGLHALFFTGAQTAKQRDAAIQAFHDDPGACVLFASDAGATGLNLQRAASCCINLELPWNPALLAQRIARLHRLGQTQPIDVYNLVTEEGIEGKIAQLLERKQAVFSSLFDGESDSVSFSGQTGLVDSVRDLVEQLPAPLTAASDASAEAELDALPEPIDVALPQVPEESPEPTEPTEPTERGGDPLARLGVRVEQRDDGSLAIQAPAALAPRLKELLATLAAQLER